MTGIGGKGAAQRERATRTSPTENPRASEQTGDPTRGTDRERGRERVAREQRFQRATAMPADPHE